MSNLDIPQVIPSFRKRQRVGPDRSQSSTRTLSVPVHLTSSSATEVRPPDDSRYSGRPSVPKPDHPLLPSENWGGGVSEPTCSPLRKKKKKSRAQRREQAQFWREFAQSGVHPQRLQLLPRQPRSLENEEDTRQRQAPTADQESYDNIASYEDQWNDRLPDDTTEMGYNSSSLNNLKIRDQNPRSRRATGPHRVPVRGFPMAQPLGTPLPQHTESRDIIPKSNEYPRTLRDSSTVQPLGRTLPPDHPIKRELENVKAVQASRQARWIDFINKMGAKWHGPNNEQQRRFAKEMEVAATKRDELVAMITKLEMGVPLERLGFASEFEERRGFEDVYSAGQSAGRGPELARGHGSHSDRADWDRSQSSGSQRHKEASHANRPSHNWMPRAEDQSSQTDIAASRPNHRSFSPAGHPASKDALKTPPPANRRIVDNEIPTDQNVEGLEEVHGESLFVSLSPSVPSSPIQQPTTYHVQEQQRWIHQGDTIIIPRKKVHPSWSADLEREFDEAEDEREQQRQRGAPAMLDEEDWETETADKPNIATGTTFTSTPASPTNDADFLTIDDEDDEPPTGNSSRTAHNKNHHYQTAIETLDLTGTSPSPPPPNNAGPEDIFSLSPFTTPKAGASKRKLETTRAGIVLEETVPAHAFSRMGTKATTTMGENNIGSSVPALGGSRALSWKEFLAARREARARGVPFDLGGGERGDEMDE